MKAWRRKLMGTVLSLALAGTLTACGQSAAPVPGQGELAEPPKAESGTGGSEGTAAKRTVYPLKITDATGKEFTFEKAPERVASTSPSETEILFALGLGDKVVGVSDFCDYPAEAKAKPKLGSIMKPNEEALIGSGADVVVSGVSMKNDTVNKLRELKVNLFKVEPKTVDDVIANILTMGRIFDRQEQAQKVVDKMKSEREQVVQAVKDLKPEEKRRVLIEFSPGWTVGSGEFLDELITLSGGVNVAAGEKGYMKINEEKVIVDNPQVILYPRNLIDDKSGKKLDEIIRARSGWEKIDAVKNNKLAGVDKDTTSRPGPRITEGLLEIAKGIYPERVK
ncbi:ABC transporter substrate-binding protein [Paenibacillus mucilaginosus]|uniref:ABC transporter substrate-binding protein n=1 Tax=Paenibacillus mucilaginosus TaxID=61624 RepID=UPI00240DE5D9|nr:ABC transporter substrate-binding protein [Paenibacillus mucilaginosus]WFA21484.1 ABC transporter substrate-binding protein [Paenibacillus mucilaginosus]